MVFLHKTGRRVHRPRGSCITAIVSSWAATGCEARFCSQGATERRTGAATRRTATRPTTATHEAESRTRRKKRKGSTTGGCPPAVIVRVAPSHAHRRRRRSLARPAGPCAPPLRRAPVREGRLPPHGPRGFPLACLHSPMPLLPQPGPPRPVASCHVPNGGMAPRQGGETCTSDADSRGGEGAEKRWNKRRGKE